MAEKQRNLEEGHEDRCGFCDQVRNLVYPVDSNFDRIREGDPYAMYRSTLLCKKCIKEAKAGGYRGR